jgi:tetratricopeptide (TPR) repeat protein
MSALATFIAAWRRLVRGVPGALAACALALSTASAARQDAGTTAAEFLRIGASGRQAGMGDSAVGLSDDSNAALTSPAAWGRLVRDEASFLRTEWLAGISYSGLSYGHTTENHGNWGAAVLWLDIPDIDGYDIGGRPRGSVQAGDRAVVIGHGRRAGDWAWGANAKWIQQELDGLKATAWAGDLGGHWRTPWLEGDRKLLLGASVRNAGTPIRFLHDEAPLPLSFDLGAGFEGLGGNLKTGLDLSMPAQGSSEWRWGAEYWVRHTVALRIGYKPDRDLGNGLSLGFGIRVRQAYVDYALVNFGDLDDTHRISLRFRFGGTVAREQAAAGELAKDGKYIPALQKLDRILEAEPYNKEALSQLRTVLQLRSRQDSRADSADPYADGVLLFRQGRYLAAMDHFMQALVRQPERENEVRRYMAVIGAEMPRREELAPEERREVRNLIRAAAESVAETPAAPRTSENYRLAQHQLSGKRYLKAHDLFLSLSQDPASPVQRKSKRHLERIRAKQIAKANRLWSKPDASFYYAAAYLAYAEGRLQQAVANWQKVLEIDRENAEVREYLPKAQRRIAAGFGTERAKFLADNARIELERRRYATALVAVMEGLTLDPANEDLRALRKAVHERARSEAQTAFDAGAWDRVVELLDDLGQSDPLEARAAALLEQARKKRGAAAAQPAPARPKPEPAAPRASPLSEESETDRQQALALYQKGLVAYAQGRLEEAVSLWTKANQLYPSSRRIQEALERARLDMKTIGR